MDIHHTDGLTARIQEQLDLSSYADPGSGVSLKGYAAALGVYGGIFGGLLALGARRGKLPRRVGFGDLALLSLATHMGSRLLTKDAVTSPLRAAFAHFEGRAGAGEVHEEPRGEGGRHVVGELLTCPYCAAPWVAAALATLLTWQPRAARMVMSVLTAGLASDFLQQAYTRLRHPSGRDERATRD